MRYEPNGPRWQIYQFKLALALHGVTHVSHYDHIP